MKNFTFLLAFFAIATFVSCSKLEDEDWYDDYLDTDTPSDTQAQTDTEPSDQTDTVDTTDTADTTDNADTATDTDTNDTDVNDTDTGDSGADTGDSGADTGDTGADTGDSGADTGDSGADTGDSGADTGDSGADTGDTGADTGDSGADTGDSGADTGDSGADTGDTGADTGDSGADTGDSGADTGDTGDSDTGDTTPECTPNCEGKVCGYNGCDGICGSDCGPNAGCNAEQTACVPYDCEQITVDQLKYRNFSGSNFQYKAKYTGNTNEDFHLMINYNNTLSGVVDLSNFPKFNYCNKAGYVCLYIQGYDNPDELYFQQSGTIDLSSFNSSNGYLSAPLGNVRLVETGYNMNTSATYEIPGGKCIEITNETLYFPGN